MATSCAGSPAPVVWAPALPTAGAEQIHEQAVRMGFTDPLYVQYGSFLKGLVCVLERGANTKVEDRNQMNSLQDYHPQDPTGP